MLPTKYIGADVSQLIDLLSSSHDLFIRVRILDMDHNYRDDVSDMFVEGQVLFDADADITRSLDITLFDPFKAVQLDPSSPSPLGIFIDNMVSVVYVVRNPLRTKTWEVPCFCGPIDVVDRDGPYLNLKALGKEKMSLVNLWRGKNYRNNQKKTEVIKSILKDLTGEVKLDIPDLSPRLNAELKLNRSDVPWKSAKRLAKTMGYQLFYDGRGVARMRRIPQTSVLNFQSSDVVTVPKVGYDMQKVINAVEVVGRKPAKAKNPITKTVVADRSHPLSPYSLGRGNPKVPRYLWMQIQDDNIRTNAEALDVAKRNLRLGLLAGVNVKYDGVPNPLLEELDIAKLSTPEQQSEFVMRQWSLPLVAGDAASYGYIRRIKPVGGRSAVRRSAR